MKAPVCASVHKVFEEERELTVILLIDISESSFFGTGKKENAT